MSPNQIQVYERIKAFRFDDDDAVLPFVSRLERENGWSRTYAVRAVAEYRKFVFLALVAGHPVSPYDEVDQVWQLHLLYTRSYWDRFCGQTLGRALHHEPSKGGTPEKDKFGTWYAATLESYRKHFAAVPPPDIWPDPETRFGTHSRFERIDRQRFCVIARTWMKAAGVMAGAAVAWFIFSNG